MGRAVTGRSAPAPVDLGLVAARVARARQRIADVAPDPGRVTLVAVTKGFGADAVRAAVAAGVPDVGENYGQELVAKATDPDVAAIGLRWHLLGAIQRNKVARLSPHVACWQSVARPEEARAIARHSPGARMLVQVETTGLAGRNGCRPGDVAGVVEAASLAGLDVVGLMTVAPPGPDVARAAFAVVARLADDLGLPERSMGMSDDFEIALEAGSTIVRLGRSLFGERPPRRAGPGVSA